MESSRGFWISGLILIARGDPPSPKATADEPGREGIENCGPRRAGLRDLRCWFRSFAPSLIQIGIGLSTKFLEAQIIFLKFPQKLFWGWEFPNYWRRKPMPRPYPSSRRTRRINSSCEIEFTCPDSNSCSRRSTSAWGTSVSAAGRVSNSLAANEARSRSVSASAFCLMSANFIATR